QLDLVIRLIRQAESPDAARDALVRQLELSEIQAKAILDMRLQRLTQLERHKVVEEHEQTMALIAELQGLLASEQKVMAIIRQELLALKEEYGDERRTEIVAETTELTIEDLLADEEMVVTITRSGYIKRTHVEAYRSQRRGGKGVTGMETKEEDIVADLFIASTHSFLLFFTTLGKVHWLKVHEIPEGGRQAKGKAMVNLLSLGEGETVATCVPVRDFAAGGSVLFATKQGKVKKTELGEYRLQGRGGKGIIDIKTGGRNGNVVAMLQVRDGDDILVVTTKGKMIRFHAADVSAQGRNTWGVRIIELDADDHVGSVARVEAEQAPVEAQ